MNRLKNLKELIKKHGYTHQQFAALMDVDRVTVSRWCVGMSTPTLEDIFRISEILDEPVCVILGLER